jgi:hypothetical protein
MPIKIEHRIGVRAPADVIWEMIYDVPGWPAWNPLYLKAAGEVRIGAKLTLEHGLDVAGPKAIQPTVIDWTPREQLHWRGQRGGGVIKTIRYIEIDSLDVASCIVANGELFQGMLVPYMLRGRGGTIRRSFEAMNEALKAEAERRWQAQAAAPTSQV